MKYRWLTEASQQFLDRDYLMEGQTLDERVDLICNRAEEILKLPGFAARMKHLIQMGWCSLSTPIWANFGAKRGLPISCFGSSIEDSMESILHTQAEVGVMTKYGGGTSAYFGNLRGRGATIQDNGESSGAVHFMQLFNSLINVVSQGSCYIEGTEVLTNNGFKDFRDILEDDKLAQLDEFNNISFTKDYELIKENFKGNLKCIRGIKRKDSVSIKVTPNHRMVVTKLKHKKRKKIWPKYTEIVTAENLKLHRDNRLSLAGSVCDGKGLSLFDRLRIAFQADGIKDGPNRKIRFHFAKQRKIDRLVALLEEANIPYSKYMDDHQTTDISFDYIAEIKKNTFQEWINLEKLPLQWCQEFLDEMSYWDGSRKNNLINYSSVIKSNVDIVQCIGCLCNKKTNLGNRPAKGNKQTLYRVCISDGSYRAGDAVETYDEPYDGKVYCAIVPHGRLLVRHEGRTLVCGNTRRGSFAAYLPIDHPDIEEFLAIRSEGNPIQDLSFGCTVPDYWLEEMIAGDTAKRKIWAKVLAARANVGYPYIVFIDNVNKNKPDVYTDKGMNITHSNLCSEILLCDSKDESFVCDLASMNILYYDEWKDTDAVETLVYFLDSVMSEFISKSEDIRFMERAVNFARNQRALGIGWLGWHSFLQSKMIPFESFEAKLLNVEVAKAIQNAAHEASRKMAGTHGYPSLLEGYGRRNTTLTAIAPTKSSAFILGQVSEGIEPHRANYYIKDLAKGKFSVRNPYLLALLAEKGKDTEEVWMSILKYGGSVQHLDFLTEQEKAVFKTFAEISPKEIIIQAAQRQKFIDQSQSLNLMIHPETPVSEINALILEAWRLGVKSLYYQFSINAAQSFARAKNILECVSCEA